MRQKKPKPRRNAPRTSRPEPAPGNLRILQDFANTVDHAKKTDLIATPQDLGDWLASESILPSGTELTKADLGRAHQVRSGLRSLFVANSGVEIQAESVKKLDRAIREASIRVRVNPDGTARFETLARTFDEAIGSLLGILVATQIEGKWSRFKICALQSCRTAYYDYSKCRTAKWCTQRCGDRVRAQRYRQGERYKSRPKYYLPRF